MNQIWYYLFALLVGFIIGYITKDLLTIEKKIEVNIKKQKVKGEGNSLDADIDVTVDEKKEKKRLFKKKKS